jgi:predicted ATPase
MIESLEIQGYRGFKHFQMNGLGRVNLLVGRNGGGKTSVLEALFILRTGLLHGALQQILRRRGEWQGGNGEDTPEQTHQDLGHLFHQHELRQGSEFIVRAKNGTVADSVTCSWKRWSPGELGKQFGLVYPAPHDALLMRFLVNSEEKVAIAGLPEQFMFSSSPVGEPPHLKYISPESPRAGELIKWWNDIELTPDEQLVVEALRFLDPRIERIAVQYEKSGPMWFKAKLAGQEQPVPIGSLGNGMSRILGTAIAITQCKGGCLLVDEIDTGLHYTVMAEMWKWVATVAEKFDVQVFATTHSADCIRALAEIALQSHVSIQRIEADRSTAITFSEQQVRIAAERNIEVR